MTESAMKHNEEEPKVKKPRGTYFWDTADSFANFATPLLGQVYRMYASAPSFQQLHACWTGPGVSLLLLPDGSGRLIVSSEESNGDDRAVRHATIPLKLAGADYCAQKCIGIELIQFKDRCVLHGESGQNSAKEACRIVNDFACEILDPDSDESDWQLKIYPSLGGHSFHFSGDEDGEEQTTLATDIVMTTPNDDELGHYLLRKTGAVVASDTVEAAVAEEVAAWDAILSVPKLAVGDKVRIRGPIESASEGGGILKAGLIGIVKQVDEDGDAEVDFGSDKEEWQWIYARSFRNLSKEFTESA